MTPESAVATAEHAVALSGSDPSRARALARSVLRSSSPIGSGAEATADGASAGAGGEATAIAHRALALAARELGDLPLAEEHLHRAVAVALAADLPHRAAQARLSLVPIRTEVGHPAQALAVARAAEPHLTPVEVARLGVHRAVALARLGRYAEAARQCDRAMGLLGEDPRFLAGALLNRGVARVFLGDFDAAESDLARCAELSRRAGLTHVLALAEGNLPFLAARRGDLPAAFTAYHRAESSLFDYPERLATMRCDLAEALIAAHLPGEARALLDRAVPELAAAGAEVALAEARLLLARAELHSGDPHRARQSAELAAAGLVAQGRANLAPLATEILLRARLALDPPCRELLTGMLACADDLGSTGHTDASGALRLTAAEVALRIGDRPTADDQLARLVRSAPAVLSFEAKAMRRILTGNRRGAFSAVRAGLAEVGARAAAFEDPMLRAHAVRAGERLAGLGLALALRTGRARTLLAWAERWRAVAGGAGRPVAPDLEELRAALGETALVEFAHHGDELVAVAITPKGVVLRGLGAFSAAAEATVRLRYGLRRAHLRDGSAPEVAEEAVLLERLLFGPLRGPLGERSLVIVPTGALHTLPWPVLPMNAGRPVSISTGAAAWLAGHRAPPPRGGEVMVVAGPGLRCAGPEADMVGACHPEAKRVVARRSVVMAALERAEVAHLAAHGTFCPRSPLLSGLDLDDGPLRAYDLLGLRTPPSLVVLSACDAGMAHAPADGAPLGLAGTFLSRGTRCVVASLVPVRDEETLTLMTAFHTSLAAGRSPAQALAAAGAKTAVAGFVCLGYGDQPVATGREGSATQLDQDPT